MFGGRSAAAAGEWTGPTKFKPSINRPMTAQRAAMEHGIDFYEGTKFPL